MTWDPMALAYAARHPEDCSNIVMTKTQAFGHALFLTGLIVCTLWRWDVVLCGVNFFLSAWYLTIIAFRCGVVLFTVCRRPEIRVTAEEMATLREEDLPTYSILVPLFREANLAQTLIPALDRLDYPRAKLDIQLLLEEQDGETREAVERLSLKPPYRVVIVPCGQPQTKPRACNYGLQHARGEFCVIYDAEDRPDPDQLKKVAVAFRRQPPEIACLQARLNFYNSRRNVLTRWFTVEYSTTFDLFLPGLQHVGVPIPLGGTSNHFRMSVLRQLDGWDPFNVTEDCDLGVRLYRAGYRTRMLDSTTWEEACSRLRHWIRQRSRWVKGFFQTHLTHTRHPWRTLRDLGLRGTLGFLLCVGGSSLMMVLNVLYWLVGGLYMTAIVHAMIHGHHLWDILKGPRPPLEGSSAWPMVYYGPGEDSFWSTLSVMFFVVSLVLLIGNVLFVVMHVTACWQRRRFDMLPWALLMPLYWVLISIGAWKGFLQLFRRPFHWEKTPHGFDAPAG